MKFGKKPRIYDERVPQYSKLIEQSGKLSLAVLPVSVNYTTVLPHNLGMYGNDTLGDCTCAAIYHAKQVWSANTSTIDTEPQNDAILAYEQFCGYVPGNPNTDNGGVEQTVLTDWMNLGAPTGANGTNRDNLVAFVEVNQHNLQNVKQAILEGGLIYIGFEVPAFFNTSSAIWDVDPNGDNTIIAGHAVVIAGYDDTTSMFTLISWGSVYKMTYAFFEQFVEEAYMLVSKQWIEATGNTPAGLTLSELEATMSSLKWNGSSRTKRRKHRRVKKQTGLKPPK